MDETKPSDHRLLVVDDDDHFRDILKSSLESAGYAVSVATSGKAAEHMLGVETFSAVITDIRMPEGNGIQLLHFCKRTSGIPVILMTGFPEFENPNEALELGAYYFLSKPFKVEDLLQALATLFNIPLAEDRSAEENQDLNYCKVDIEDFITGKELLYDIYIRLSEYKYVKMAHRGESLPPERVKIYKSKNIHYLYMKKDDFIKYVGFSVNLSKVIKSTGVVSKAKKIQFMKHATEVVLEQLHLEGVSEESFDNAKTVLDSSLSVMTDADDVMNMLSMLSDHSDHLYAHSLGVSIHATMIAKAVGWRSPLVLFKVAMGGLLHDIGKKEIPKEILNKPRTQLSVAELKIMESHTIRGAEILSQLPSVPSDVIQIAAQHHENLLGLGYPAALKSKFIHPMAKLVSVANEFCDLVIKRPYSIPLKPDAAIHKMAILFADTLDHNFFIALTKVYNVQLNPEYEETLKRKRKYETGGA